MQTQTLTLPNGHAELRCRYEERDRAKMIPGYAFDRVRKSWKYPISSRLVDDVLAVFPHCKIDPAVHVAVASFIDRDRVVAAVKDAGWQHATPCAPMPISVEPFQHQIAAFNVAMALPNVALLMEMGTGKTLTTVAALGRRYLDRDIRRALVVCPASVAPVWPAEFAQFAKFPHDVRVLDGAVAKRKTALAGWIPDYRCPMCGSGLDESVPDCFVRGEAICFGCERRVSTIDLDPALQVAVTNYESTWRMTDELAAWKPDVIVCDESQRIKTPSASQSKAMHALGKIAKYRMILTGTPVTAHPMDFFSQYKFLDPSIFGPTFTPFRTRYATMGGFENRQVVAYRDLPDLVSRAHSIAFRVTKDEALDLPDQIDQKLYCDLDTQSRKTYDAIKDEAVALLESGEHVTANNVLTRLMRLQQVTGGWVHDDEGAVSHVSDAKIGLLANVLDDALAVPERKVVVFARFREEIKAIIREVLKFGADEPYGLIWGDTPMSERGEIVEKFQTDAACRVFVAQIQSAGLGITLTAADVAVFYSLDFNFANYDQARSRLHRIGQRKPVTNIHLLARNTVDEAVMGVLARKKSVADMVVDGGWRDVLNGRTAIGIDEIGRSRRAS